MLHPDNSWGFRLDSFILNVEASTPGSRGRGRRPGEEPGTLPDGAGGQVAVGAAGGGAGARVVEYVDEGVGRVADHGLQVEAVLGERGDGQRALPAGPRGQPGAGEAGAWGKGEASLGRSLTPT